MISCEEDNKDPPTIEGLINRYRQWTSTKRTHTKTLSSFVAQEATLAITEPNPKSKNNRKKCSCGLPHSVLNCYTLNPKAEGRPQGFKPSLKILRAVLASFKNTELLEHVKKLYKDNNIPWTFDIAKASAEIDEAQNRTEKSN
jgi:hypothetical protein